jgi:hypothetical protein
VIEVQEQQLKISVTVLDAISNALKDKPLQYYIDKAHDEVIAKELTQRYRRLKNKK